jgi:hypothetical protein
LDASSRTGGTVVAFSAVGNTLVKHDGDGRMAPRRRVLKSGIAASNDRRLTVNCTVRDLSDTGARLRVEGSMTVPDTFELLIPLDGLEASCQVVWRKGGEVGVRFLSAPRIVAAKRTQVVSAVVPAKAVTLRRVPTLPTGRS